LAPNRRLRGVELGGLFERGDRRLILLVHQVCHALVKRSVESILLLDLGALLGHLLFQCGLLLRRHLALQFVRDLARFQGLLHHRLSLFVAALSQIEIGGRMLPHLAPDTGQFVDHFAVDLEGDVERATERYAGVDVVTVLIGLQSRIPFDVRAVKLDHRTLNGLAVRTGYGAFDGRDLGHQGNGGQDEYGNRHRQIAQFHGNLQLESRLY
jgi:hypothetical protein